MGNGVIKVVRVDNGTICDVGANHFFCFFATEEIVQMARANFHRGDCADGARQLPVA